MYPFKFDHIYFNKIWGGRSLEALRDDLPEDNIGESWDISCHKDGTNTIINGKYKGMLLQDLIDKYPKEILGRKFKNSYFPLHISLLDAKDNLSVQVHPNDEFALKVECEPGKAEAWYILDCEEDSAIIAGLKPCSLKQVEQAIMNDSLDSLLNRVRVKKGDLVFIPSGMVHALGKGILALEISQNSNTTYRVFDYGRGRELHREKALKVINTDLQMIYCRGKEEENDYNIINHRFKSEKFNIDTIEVKKYFKDLSSPDTFFTFVCVLGSGYLEFDEGIIPIHTYDSVFIPSNVGEFRFVGNMTLVKSYI